MATAKIVFDDALFEDYKKAAVKWKKELLHIPVRTLGDVTKYMRGVGGVRKAIMLPEVKGNSQFGPFSATRKHDGTVSANWRPLITYHGNVIEEFSPVEAAELIIGENDALNGEAIKTGEVAKLVLTEQAVNRGQYLAQAIFTGKRKENGSTSADLFDGFNTIAEQEITAGKISAEKNNLYQLPVLTMANAADELKNMLFSRDPFLRAKECVLLVSPSVADKYNESYLATHSATPYNTKYNQPYLEGSGNRVTIVALPELEGSDYFYLAPKENFLYGYDTDAEGNTLDIMRPSHYTLSFAADIYFGVQFHSIDPTMLTVIKATKAAANVDPNAGGNNGGGADGN